MWCVGYSFAIVGMTLFGGVPAETDSDLENQRYRFDSFLSASLALFQMCTENNWNSIMYPNIRQTSIFYALYFVTFFVLLVTLALNIVVGIIIDGFQLTQQRREDAVRVEQVSFLLPFHFTRIMLTI